jgi:hypothetical protein
MAEHPVADVLERHVDVARHLGALGDRPDQLVAPVRRVGVEDADPEVALDRVQLPQQRGERGAARGVDGVRGLGRSSQVSMPKNVVSCEMRLTSLTPSATSWRTSATTLATVRLRCLPRIWGMMQKVHGWLQPSAIFT